MLSRDFQVSLLEGESEISDPLLSCLWQIITTTHLRRDLTRGIMFLSQSVILLAGGISRGEF